jgi:hypothetical protein
MASNLKTLMFRFFVSLSLIASVWSSAAYAQKLHSFTHEELEDHRQENVVKNMHFADDVMKTKFLEVYVPYQERLFHVDHEIRDLTTQYVQADQQNAVRCGGREVPRSRDQAPKRAQRDPAQLHREAEERGAGLGGASRLGSRK